MCVCVCFIELDYFQVSYKLDAREEMKKIKLLAQLKHPAKFYSPFWCTVPLQYVYKCLITQAIANWVTYNIVQNDYLFVESILSFVIGETINCSLSKSYFGNVM